MALLDLLLLAAAVSAISVTLSLSNACQPLRKHLAKLGSWVDALVHCPYCLSHWFAFAGVLYYQPGTPVEIGLYTFACVTLASLFATGIVRLFLLLDALEAGENE